LKEKYPTEYITQRSDKITQRIAENPLFLQAETVAIYHALPDEVQTAGFIEKWHLKKKILLPVVEDKDISLQLYKGKESLKAGCFGILEPDCTEKGIKPDLIIVPGIAFDHQCNRLGRGKGYYDRLLSDTSVPTIGICFHFQLFDQIPTDVHDQKMSIIITDQEIIMNKEISLSE
jgi:5-formyltetrahydrofolate cyclo-ligase